MAMTDVQRNVRENVREHLTWDNRISSANIDISVDEGTVELNGDVPTSFSKLAAEEDAWSVTGVTEVRNNLKVKYNEKYPPPADSEIKKTVEDMLKLDQRLESSEIIVEVNNAVVTLTGTVDAFWKKSVAEQYTHRAAGVIDVSNKLKITPASEFDDASIAQDIKRALERNSITRNCPIKVDVKNGEVTLSGNVMSTIEKTTARDIAYFTAGVKEVRNNLTRTHNQPIDY